MQLATVGKSLVMKDAHGTRQRAALGLLVRIQSGPARPTRKLAAPGEPQSIKLRARRTPS
jgi:hypothetical protein